MIVALCLPGEAAAARSGRTQIYLLRGIFNVSVGLDALAAKLARRGYSTSVHGHGEAGIIAAQAAADYRAGRVRSIILVGHSLGAGAAVLAAQQLNQEGVPVTLIVSLDPVGALPVPPNVRRVVNYFVSTSGVPLESGRGVRNIDMKGVAGMDHMTIQSMDMMHRRIMGDIGAR